MKKLKYPPEFKAEVCEYAKKESIVYASILYNLHRNTIGNWVKKYKKSGIRGFTVIRKDTQETKLDKAILNRIARYKRRNPKATLKMIREKFGIDCHITLIGRKLKKVYVPVKRKKQKETLFLQTKIIRDAEYKNSNHPVFRLSLHLCSGKPISVGFSSWYSSEKICLFIRYSLEKLRVLKAKHIIKKIITSTKFIKKDDFATLVSNYHDIELQIVKAGEYKVCSDDGINFSEKGIKQSLIESYDKILEEYNSHELSNLLLTSLVNINELSKNDIAGKSWDSLFMPSETKKSFYNALEKIKEKGNKAVLEFDYDTAKNEYHKAYSAMTALKIDDKEMYLSILSEKAKLYYNMEQYQTALMLYRDIVKFSMNCSSERILADAYYFLGLIHRSYQNIKRTIQYFRLSAKVLENSKKNYLLCMYYRAKYREFLVKEKYNIADRFSRLYYEYAIKTKNKELIGNCLSTKDAYLYRIGKYEMYEKALVTAKEYNIKNGNYYDACDNITNLYSIYSYYLKKEDNVIDDLLFELKAVSKKNHREYLVYSAMFKTGIHYAGQNKYLPAINILTKSLPGVKKYLDRESFLSNLCYIGRMHYFIENMSKALRYFNYISRISNRSSDVLYLLQAYNFILRIYIQRNDNPKVQRIFKIAIKKSVECNRVFFIGNFHFLYAEYLESKNKLLNYKFHYSIALKRYEELFKKGDLSLSDEIEYLKNKVYSPN